LPEIQIAKKPKLKSLIASSKLNLDFLAMPAILAILVPAFGLFEKVSAEAYNPSEMSRFFHGFT